MKSFAMLLLLAACTLSHAQTNATADANTPPAKEPRSTTEIQQALIANCLAIPACAEQLRADVDYSSGVIRSYPSDPPRPLADIKARALKTPVK